MEQYGIFADFYDQLTTNVCYGQRAEYFHRLLQKHALQKPVLLLDLACGTGSLSLAMAQLGYDVIGVDASAQMLSVAMNKCSGAGVQILFLNQTMQQLDLYGTVDAVVCALDSVNHITDAAVLQQAFDRVSLFLQPGGVFVFDCNTLYKQKQILADNCFIYETPDVYCAWQNRFVAPDQTEITLDFFVAPGHKHGGWQRYTEQFYERVYPTGQLQQMLEQAGLCLQAVYAADTLDPPQPDTQRLVLVAIKPV